MDIPWDSAHLHIRFIYFIFYGIIGGGRISIVITEILVCLSAKKRIKQKHKRRVIAKVGYLSNRTSSRIEYDYGIKVIRQSTGAPRGPELSSSVELVDSFQYK